MTIAPSPTGNNGRIYNYGETFDNGWNINPVRSMRGGRYKVVTRGAKRELYNLETDPHEARNLLPGPLNAEQSEAYSRLLAEMAKLLATR